MIHVITLTNEAEAEKYGECYLFNFVSGVDLPFAYAFSPKRECYIKRTWDTIRFSHFLDEKGHKYDKYLKRIKEK